ncbi:hypothetical protein D3C76_1533470 [compost metagenome]
MEQHDLGEVMVELDGSTTYAMDIDYFGGSGGAGGCGGSGGCGGGGGCSGGSGGSGGCGGGNSIIKDHNS